MCIDNFFHHSFWCLQASCTIKERIPNGKRCFGGAVSTPVLLQLLAATCRLPIVHTCHRIDAMTSSSSDWDYSDDLSRLSRNLEAPEPWTFECAWLCGSHAMLRGACARQTQKGVVVGGQQSQHLLVLVLARVLLRNIATITSNT